MSSDEVFGLDRVTAPTAREAADLDRRAIDQGGIPGRLLMENAGRSAALVIDRLYPRGKAIALLGPGNNGGDGLVLLRNLRAWGWDVAYISTTEAGPDRALTHDFQIPRLEAGDSAGLVSADLLIDGLVGTGTSGPPYGTVAELITTLAEEERPIIALDLPSGVDPTTGAVPGPAVRADLTITFGAPKRGLLLQPAREYCGRVIAIEIGLPPSKEDPSAELITPGWARRRLPTRPLTAYKGTSGRLLALTGTKGMAGAAIIAGEAALRAGTGYLWLASDPSNRTVLQGAIPEAIFIPRTETDELLDLAVQADAILVGPGIGTDDEVRTLTRELYQTASGQPLLLDADALDLIGQDDGLIRELAHGRELILTPHPGEFARLTGKEVDTIVANPIGTAEEYAEMTGATLLLKGTPTVIASPGTPTLINTLGSSDLARAGMGDQLAGTIAALLAAGLRARAAAGAGLFYAGRAAELAGRGRALSPRDLSAHLAEAFADPGPPEPPLGLPFITFDQPRRW